MAYVDVTDSLYWTSTTAGSGDHWVFAASEWGFNTSYTGPIPTSGFTVPALNWSDAYGGPETLFSDIRFTAYNTSGGGLAVPTLIGELQFTVAGTVNVNESAPLGSTTVITVSMGGNRELSDLERFWVSGQGSFYNYFDFELIEFNMVAAEQEFWNDEITEHYDETFVS